MDKINLTLNEAGSLLLGAGLIKVAENITLGLILIGAGAVIKVGVAILKKYGVVISGKKK